MRGVLNVGTPTSGVEDLIVTQGGIAAEQDTDSGVTPGKTKVVTVENGGRSTTKKGRVTLCEKDICYNTV